MSTQRRRKISQDTRESIIRLVIQQGRSKREVARLIKVPKNTVRNIVKRYEMKYSTQPGITGGAWRTVLNDEISEQIRNIRPNDGDIKALRMEYARWYNSLTHLVRYRNVIFIDESPFSLHMFKIHSLAAIAGIINSESLMTGVDGTIFQSFIEECTRILGEDENYILVMDHIRFHHTINLEGNENMSVRYLPAYSPFLNPWEEPDETVATVKRRISKARSIDSSFYLLYFGPERLDDFQSLSFYGITDHSFLEMINGNYHPLDDLPNWRVSTIMDRHSLIYYHSRTEETNNHLLTRFELISTERDMESMMFIGYNNRRSLAEAKAYKLVEDFDRIYKHK
ncbi:hypothetical protein RF11_08187 [Thelohanellus kitauei]|uniref:Ubiquitin-like domain-containing protein n=1 Tax=Thelohanellus kitauei TaxID=669202 RepID=A0A0C2NIF7_THEKT|nr:hypothetical protein RF11_08187 [Thelohanellus kitauei]